MCKIDTRANTLAAYRKLFRMCFSLPKDKRVESSARIRSEFRKNIVNYDDKSASEALRTAFSSLSYIKMTTPRYAKNNSDSGVTRLRFGPTDPSNEHKTVHPVVTNWTGKNLDPDSVKKHYHQLNRMGYKNNREVKGWF